jgi:hypothetical protein
VVLGWLQMGGPSEARLADYFCVVGVRDGGKKAETISRFPSAEHKDFPLPKELPLFIFPNGLQRSSEPVAPRFATFVLTRQSGQKIFAAFLIFFEREQTNWDVGSPEYGKTSFVAKALCLLSSWPYYRGFQRFLHVLLDRAWEISHPKPNNAVTASLGVLVSRFMQIRLPSPARRRVLFSPMELRVHLGRSNPGLPLCFPIPALRDFPMSDSGHREMFERLDLDNVLSLLTLVLLECKICLFAKDDAVPAAVLETVRVLLYPFDPTVNIFIPRLPEPLAPMLDSPVPFLCGVTTSTVERYWGTHSDGQLRMPPNEIYAIDLDRNDIFRSYELTHEEPEVLWHLLPESLRTRLHCRFAKAVGAMGVTAPPRPPPRPALDIDGAAQGDMDLDEVVGDGQEISRSASLRGMSMRNFIRGPGGSGWSYFAGQVKSDGEESDGEDGPSSISTGANSKKGTRWFGASLFSNTAAELSLGEDGIDEGSAAWSVKEQSLMDFIGEQGLTAPHDLGLSRARSTSADLAVEAEAEAEAAVAMATSTEVQSKTKLTKRPSEDDADSWDGDGPRPDQLSMMAVTLDDDVKGTRNSMRRRRGSHRRQQQKEKRERGQRRRKIRRRRQQQRNAHTCSSGSAVDAVGVAPSVLREMRDAMLCLSADLLIGYQEHLLGGKAPCSVESLFAIGPFIAAAPDDHAGFLSRFLHTVTFARFIELKNLQRFQSRYCTKGGASITHMEYKNMEALALLDDAQALIGALRTRAHNSEHVDGVAAAELELGLGQMQGTGKGPLLVDVVLTALRQRPPQNTILLAAASSESGRQAALPADESEERKMEEGGGGSKTNSETKAGGSKQLAAMVAHNAQPTMAQGTAIRVSEAAYLAAYGRSGISWHVWKETNGIDSEDDDAALESDEGETSGDDLNESYYDDEMDSDSGVESVDGEDGDRSNQRKGGEQCDRAFHGLGLLVFLQEHPEEAAAAAASIAAAAVRAIHHLLPARNTSPIKFGRRRRRSSRGMSLIRSPLDATLEQQGAEVGSAGEKQHKRRNHSLEMALMELETDGGDVSSGSIGRNESGEVGSAEKAAEKTELAAKTAPIDSEGASMEGGASVESVASQAAEGDGEKKEGVEEEEEEETEEETEEVKAERVQEQQEQAQALAAAEAEVDEGAEHVHWCWPAQALVVSTAVAGTDPSTASANADDVSTAEAVSAPEMRYLDPLVIDRLLSIREQQHGLEGAIEQLLPLQRRNQQGEGSELGGAAGAPGFTISPLKDDFYGSAASAAHQGGLGAASAPLAMPVVPALPHTEKSLHEYAKAIKQVVQYHASHAAAARSEGLPIHSDDAETASAQSKIIRAAHTGGDTARGKVMPVPSNGLRGSKLRGMMTMSGGSQSAQRRPCSVVALLSVASAVFFVFGMVDVGLRGISSQWYASAATSMSTSASAGSGGQAIAWMVFSWYSSAGADGSAGFGDAMAAASVVSWLVPLLAMVPAMVVGDRHGPKSALTAAISLAALGSWIQFISAATLFPKVQQASGGSGLSLLLFGHLLVVVAAVGAAVVVTVPAGRWLYRNGASTHTLSPLAFYSPWQRLLATAMPMQAWVAGKVLGIWIAQAFALVQHQRYQDWLVGSASLSIAGVDGTSPPSASPMTQGMNSSASTSSFQGQHELLSCLPGLLLIHAMLFTLLLPVVVHYLADHPALHSEKDRSETRAFAAPPPPASPPSILCGGGLNLRVRFNSPTAADGKAALETQPATSITPGRPPPGAPPPPFTSPPPLPPNGLPPGIANFIATAADPNTPEGRAQRTAQGQTPSHLRHGQHTDDDEMRLGSSEDRYPTTNRPVACGCAPFDRIAGMIKLTPRQSRQQSGPGFSPLPARGGGSCAPTDQGFSSLFAGIPVDASYFSSHHLHGQSESAYTLRGALSLALQSVSTPSWSSAQPQRHLALLLATAAPLIAVLTATITLWQQFVPATNLTNDAALSEAAALTTLGVFCLVGSGLSIWTLRAPVLAARSKVRVRFTSSDEVESGSAARTNALPAVAATAAVAAATTAVTADTAAAFGENSDSDMQAEGSSSQIERRESEGSVHSSTAGAEEAVQDVQEVQGAEEESKKESKKGSAGSDEIGLPQQEDVAPTGWQLTAATGTSMDDGTVEDPDEDSDDEDEEGNGVYAMGLLPSLLNFSFLRGSAPPAGADELTTSSGKTTAVVAPALPSPKSTRRKGWFTSSAEEEGDADEGGSLDDVDDEGSDGWQVPAAAGSSIDSDDESSSAPTLEAHREIQLTARDSFTYSKANSGADADQEGKWEEEEQGHKSVGRGLRHILKDDPAHKSARLLPRIVARAVSSAIPAYLLLAIAVQIQSTSSSSAGSTTLLVLALAILGTAVGSVLPVLLELLAEVAPSGSMELSATITALYHGCTALVTLLLLVVLEPMLSNGILGAAVAADPTVAGPNSSLAGAKVAVWLGWITLGGAAAATFVISERLVSEPLTSDHAEDASTEREGSAGSSKGSLPLLGQIRATKKSKTRQSASAEGVGGATPYPSSAVESEGDGDEEKQHPATVNCEDEIAGAGEQSTNDAGNALTRHKAKSKAPPSSSNDGSSVIAASDIELIVGNGGSSDAPSSEGTAAVAGSPQSGRVPPPIGSPELAPLPPVLDSPAFSPSAAGCGWRASKFAQAAAASRDWSDSEVETGEDDGAGSKEEADTSANERTGSAKGGGSTTNASLSIVFAEDASTGASSIGAGGRSPLPGANATGSSEEWVELVLPAEADAEAGDEQKLFYNRRTGKAQLHRPQLRSANSSPASATTSPASNAGGDVATGTGSASPDWEEDSLPAETEVPLKRIKVQKGGTDSRPTWVGTTGHGPDTHHIKIDAAIM